MISIRCAPSSGGYSGSAASAGFGGSATSASASAFRLRAACTRSLALALPAKAAGTRSAAANAAAASVAACCARCAASVSATRAAARRRCSLAALVSAAIDSADKREGRAIATATTLSTTLPRRSLSGASDRVTCDGGTHGLMSSSPRTAHASHSFRASWRPRSDWPSPCSCTRRHKGCPTCVSVNQVLAPRRHHPSRWEVAT